MRLRFEQLSDYLKKSIGGESKNINNLFFLSGNEPLQMMEAADQIRRYAQHQGFDERDILSFDGAKADWSTLTAASMEQSLFSQKKILDITLSGSQPGINGSKALRQYVETPPDDKFLLLQTAKLDKNARTSAWVKALEKKAVMIQVWDLSPAQTLAWVAKRMREAGLRPSQDAIQLLTERIEGNLLAANQEIQKLVLLFGQIEINVDQVMQVVADSSRFTVFDLSDAVLQGDIKRLHHVLSILREEATPLPLVLWSLATLSWQLHDICYRVSSGESITQAIQMESSIPRARQMLFSPAIRRLHSADWSTIMQRNFSIECMSKGLSDTRIRDASRIWDEVLNNAVALSGRQLLASTKP